MKSSIDNTFSNNPLVQAVEDARYAAILSPCRSKRGVSIFRAGRVWAVGTNRPPSPLVCDASDLCRSTCSLTAVHAEQEAILEAGLSFCKGSDMLHVKVVDNEIVPSGPPSCVQCSKLALKAGIVGFWLYHIDGWERYEMLDFHQRSLAENRLK